MTNEEINKAAEYAEKAFPIIHGNKLCDEKIYSLNEMHKYAREAIVEFVKKAGAAFTQPQWKYVERDGLPEHNRPVRVAYIYKGGTVYKGQTFTDRCFYKDGFWHYDDGTDTVISDEDWQAYAWKEIETETPPPLKP